MNKQSEIICPTCSKHNTWHEGNPYRPFCSSRCKLIDLGEWANETHTIPGEAVTQEHSDNDNSFEF